MSDANKGKAASKRNSVSYANPELDLDEHDEFAGLDEVIVGM